MTARVFFSGPARRACDLDPRLNYVARAVRFAVELQFLFEHVDDVRG